ncbi:YIP1 family protein [Pelagivirga sediminicola]|uniref:YIP1 family protein n=1 Tax=Pelagivirga sediminicola TaxID=2170575 RepID=A0A2T7G343_9RHOB|nr:Yip1 family protein [Pelagivirga sediminicola]PVA08839.1 YIP1 family protein [Pelagivirga sediminicola]
MNLSFVPELVGQTLFSPRAAADRIMALWLPRQWLWTALALTSVLNGIVFSLTLHVGPPRDPEMLQAIPPAFQSPFLFTLFLLGALVITVMTLTWIGRSLGGAGEVPQVLALIVWLQVLRLGVQLALVVLMLAIPVAGVLLVFAASVWGIVILVAFIDRAHGFGNVFKAIAVLVLAVLAVVVGLSAILSVFVAVAMGVT